MNTKLAGRFSPARASRTHSGRQRMRAAQLTLLGFVLMATPAVAQDRAIIDQLNERFLAALQKGDMAAIGQMYAEDAYLLPAGADMVRGRAAIQAFWTAAAE